MSIHMLSKGHSVKIGGTKFVIHQKLSENRWQLQNTATGEWCAYTDDDLLDRFVDNELLFEPSLDDRQASSVDRLAMRLARALSTYPPELVARAQDREQYLKEIDRRQPIAITSKTMGPLIRSVAERIKDTKPPAWRTVSRDYRRWLAAGRDIRALISRHSDRGRHGTQMLPEVRAITDRVISELYMTPERKRIPEVHLEIVRCLAEANEFRSECDSLSVPSQRTIYREIADLPPHEVMAARYGKRRAEMEFRVSMAGPVTSRALERVVMDHTPSDLVVVDDRSMLPLGRPTITTALDEHTRCPMGFYTSFEPPSCLSVMRCLKHAILPKTYVPRDYPSVKNRWDCYGVPELVVVDNPPEFHSRHFELACLQIGCDIQYAKVLVPWYKGKIERFLRTLNHDLMHGRPGTTFSNVLERDEYDPGKHAVVLLSTLREMLHKWIVDVYMRMPHRGIKDTPAHRWQSETCGLPPPLPPSAGALDVALGMTAQRVAFHYGIELEGLKYNGPELGELRRRIGPALKVELTFDPGDLGHIHVIDPLKGTYIYVSAVNQAYAKGLSLWQNRVIRRYAQHLLEGRTDIVALAQAKAEIRALVERDFNRKSTRGRKRHARFMENHARPLPFDRPTNQAALTAPPDGELHSRLGMPPPPEVHPMPDAPAGQLDVFTDDEILPVFEAGLDLPCSLIAPAAPASDATLPEEVDE
ncbi:MAG: Mu transposase C-terminal domain-containing protein [Terriglobia bacterium]